jgi:type I restriction enzyme S subunit
MKMRSVKLGEAATFVNGYAFKPEQWNTSGKEIIRIQNLTNSTSSANYFKGELPQKYKINKGDLLISWSGTLGIFEWTKEEAWLNQHIFKVVFDKYEFDKRFFYYLISHYIHQLENEVHGSTMKHITKKRFDDIQIPLPNFETQKKIAEILDKADELRQNDKKILEKYDQLSQSVFLEMFGDPVKNEKNWQMESLGSLVKNENSKRVPVKESIRDLKDEIYPYYGATGQIDMIDEYKFDGEYLLIAEDGKNLLYRRKNNAFIVSGKFWVNNHAHVLSYNGSIDLRFLEFILNSYDLKPYVTGIDQFKLNRENLDKILIPVPSQSLQTKFSSIVEIINKQKKLSAQSLQKSEDLFRSLLQKAFKGELV